MKVVPKTGQITPFLTGDDGSLQKGVAWPTPRFTDNNNGTVTDNLTKLIWTKNANAFGQRTWVQALSDANNLQAGYGGLTDGSKPGDWRLPNLRELQSLIDYGRSFVALPAGHPFVGVVSDHYWSSTTCIPYTDRVWYVSFFGGDLDTNAKSGSFLYVWCVRGGP